MDDVTLPALIFLAEDDPAMRSMLRLLMTRSGFDVVACADGASLIHEIQLVTTGAPSPQVIISDVQMPGKGGLEVVEVSKRCLPEVPVILITAFGDERTHRRARDLGATAVLNKPFALTDLQRLVVEAMASASNG